MKKDLIIESAIELFANNGIGPTSTRNIAEKAGVSEALIFKYFKNKDNLFKSCHGLAMERAYEFMENVFTKEDPKELLIGMIDMLKDMDTEYHLKWKLIIQTKWEIGPQIPIDPIYDILEKSLSSLGYENARNEGIFLFNCLEGIIFRYYMHDINLDEQLRIVKEKYNLI